MKKIFFINFLVVLVFIWFTEYYLHEIKYNISNINKKELSNVLNFKNKIQKNHKENIKKLIKDGYYPNLYPYTSISIPSIKKISNKTNFIPLGGQPNNKVFLCDEGYGYIKYKSDHLGFRNEKEDWNEYPYNAIIIGDSYVHGSCVDDENTISGNLKKFKIKNINLAQGDNGPSIYSQLLDQFSKPVPPKNIIVIFSLHNDFLGEHIYDELQIERKDYIFSEVDRKHILSKRGEKYFELVNNELNEIILKNDFDRFTYMHENSQKLKSILKLSKIRQLIKLKFNILIKKKFLCIKDKCLIGDYKDLLKYKTSNSIKVINKLLDICNYENNCNPTIVTIPMAKYWDNSFDSKILKKYINKEIENIQNERFMFNYIDGSKVIDYRNLENYAPAGGHLSNIGYRRIAEALREKIK